MGMAGTLIMLAAIFLLAMIALSRRANAQLPEGETPVHFDWRGRPTALGSRWVVLGMMPVSYVFVHALMAAITFSSGGNASPGEILGIHLFLGVVLSATHLFLLWLLLRWARDNQAR